MLEKKGEIKHNLPDLQDSHCYEQAMPARVYILTRSVLQIFDVSNSSFA